MKAIFFNKQYIGKLRQTFRLGFTILCIPLALPMSARANLVYDNEKSERKAIESEVQSETGYKGGGNPFQTKPDPAIQTECADYIDEEGNPKDLEGQSAYFGQKVTYCQMATDAEKARIREVWSRNAWIPVAATCTAACIASFVPGAGQALGTACSVGQMLVGGADTVMKMALKSEYSSTISEITTFTAGISAAAGGVDIMGGLGKKADAANLPESADAPTPETPEGGKAPKVESDTSAKDEIMACATAALTVANVVLRELSAQAAQEAVQINLNEAHNYSPEYAEGSFSAGSETGDTARAKSQGRTISGISDTPNAKKDKGGEETFFAKCGGGGANGGFTQAVSSCAVAGDNAPFLRDRNFNDKFQQAWGTSPGQMASAANGKSAGEFMSAAASALGLSGKAAGAVVEKTKQKLAPFKGGTLSGGGRAAMDEGGGDPDIAGMMAGLLGGMNGEEKKEGGMASALNFSLKEDPRTPDEIAADRSKSLFDRVTFRYAKARRSLAELPWASPYNRNVMTGN